MTTLRWMLWAILAAPTALLAQGPPAGFFPWWDSPIASGLELTDAQRAQIHSVTGEYRGRMMEVRDAVRKAESDLESVFNEDVVDQRRGMEAIDRLTSARAEMTKAVAELSLRMRAVLTPQQWQELRQRERATRIENVGRGSAPPARGGGRGRRGPKGSPQRAETSAAPASTPQ
jgi:Spy/CpxP family protein refolding chaperone